MTDATLPAHFQIPFAPVADQAATVHGPNVRFTVLTSRLLRLEFSSTGQFEDRPSQAFWHRQQPVPQFQANRSDKEIEVVTEHLRLNYRPSGRGFHRKTLSIATRSQGSLWRYGDRDWDNLRGTARTLDQANGAIRLERGLVSRSGWAVVDDSDTLVFDENSWLQPRERPGNLDLYFFGYGSDYLACLQDFARVAGTTPLIPRWMLGNWWSRYWAYTEEELRDLMVAFRERQVPLSICIVDMDWHLTETGNACSGWTGYTWNRELFPDPEGFIAWLHGQGLRTALNLHPAEGVHSHEAVYEGMARRLGVDPATEEPLPFDLADPAFAAAYFEMLHHPLEVQGVDFWWIDWQQGTLSGLPGLDPLWWLNHLHYLDHGRAGHQRPVIFSRWGGLGNHRYPIGFSGDTVVSWQSLAFQPYFTATAANVGYSWWSHDIGGHWAGIEDRELYTRWVQYGVFSPIFRLHSTKNPYHERLPWGWDAEVFRVTREAMQLRHALIPYLYSMAWRNATESRPPILPMYYEAPEAEEAYRCPNQYLFGSELLAAPFVSPADEDTQLSSQAVWLPEGDWFHFFDGRHYAGGGWHMAYGELQDIPVFARAGAIVPLGPMGGWGGVDNPEHLMVHIFPGADNRFELYEDDGETQGYREGHHCLTALQQEWRDDQLAFAIYPAQGDISLVPERRRYTLAFRGVAEPGEVVAAINGKSAAIETAYDRERETLTVTGLAVRPADEVLVILQAAGPSLLAPRDRRLETCRRYLKAFRLDTQAKQQIDSDLPAILEGSVSLRRYGQALKDAHLHVLGGVVGVK